MQPATALPILIRMLPCGAKPWLQQIPKNVRTPESCSALGSCSFGFNVESFFLQGPATGPACMKCKNLVSLLWFGMCLFGPL